MNLAQRRIRRLALVALAGCGAEEHPVIFTDHLEVELYDSDEICRGSLEDMEAQAKRVAQLLDVEVPSRIHVHYGLTAVDQHCSEKHAGCIWNPQNFAADEGSVYHELVHAVRYGNGLRATRFIEEGIAEVLSGFRPRPYQVFLEAGEVEQGPAMLMKVPSKEFSLDDYETSAHFFSWLRSRYGDDVLVPFLADKEAAKAETVETAFLKHFGMEVQEADDEWRASSAAAYVWGELCDPPDTFPWDGSTLEFKGRIDCVNADTMGPSYDGRITTRSKCFTLDSPSKVRIELHGSANRAWASFVQVGCLANGESPTDEYIQKSVLTGEVTELPFGACEWMVVIASPGAGAATRKAAEPMEFSLRLTKI